MAIRKRTIQPSIWQDPDFGTLSPITQLIFIGLITQADDEGRFNGHPAVVRSALFPYGTVELEQIINSIKEITVKMRNFTYYEVNGQYYGQFRRWSDHQVLREDRLQKSIYPPPPRSDVTGIWQAHDGQVGTEVSKKVSKGSKEGSKNFSTGEHPIDKVRRELEERGIFKKTTLI